MKELERYIVELEGALAEAVRERDEARQQLKAERAARAANAKRAERARAAAATARGAATTGDAATAGGAETWPEVTASQLEAPKEATDEPLQRALEERRALQAALDLEAALEVGLEVALPRRVATADKRARAGESEMKQVERWLKVQEGEMVGKALEPRE